MQHAVHLEVAGVQVLPVTFITRCMLDRRSYAMSGLPAPACGSLTYQVVSGDDAPQMATAAA